MHVENASVFVYEHVLNKNDSVVDRVVVVKHREQEGEGEAEAVSR